MRSTEVNARSEEVFGNQYAMPGGDGSYVNANMGYGPAEEEKGVNERRAPANMNLLTIGKLCGLLGIDASEGEFSLFKKQDISVAAQRHGNLIVPDIARETTLGTDSVVAVVPIEQNDSLTPLYAKKHL